MNCCNNMGAGDQVSHGNRQNLWCFTLNNQAYVTPKWREQRTQQQQWKTEVPTYRHSQQKYYRNLSNFWHLLNARLTVFDRKLPGLNYNRERKPLIDLVVTQSDMWKKKVTWIPWNTRTVWRPSAKAGWEGGKRSLVATGAQNHGAAAGQAT